MKISIVGATAYTSRELIKILLRHPEAEIVHLGGRREGNPPISDIFTDLRNLCDMPVLGMDPGDCPEKPDVAFFTLPHALSQDFVAPYMAAGIRCVDFSADYRFDDVDLYARFYGEHRDPENVARAVYGIPELFRARVTEADLVGNPGCYPTSVALGLAPLVEMGLVGGPVNVCSMSGVSGAGNKPKEATMFCECNEDVRAYSVEGHRHEPEMGHAMRLLGGDPSITFVSHLVPMDRGILSTIIVPLSEERDTESLRASVAEYYSGERFVRVHPVGAQPRTKDVAFTNMCDIGVVVRGGRTAIVTSAIDNLVKGAAGQAVQNMNCMFGLDEGLGLL